jgi:hypothetical protein
MFSVLLTSVHVEKYPKLLNNEGVPSTRVKITHRFCKAFNEPMELSVSSLLPYFQVSRPLDNIAVVDWCSHDFKMEKLARQNAMVTPPFL